MIGRTGPRVPRITKLCVICGTAFTCGGSDGSVNRTHCSMTCAGNARHGKARIMSEIETAWLSGVFDGEGCIVWANRRKTKPILVLQIGNTSRELIERVIEVTGCGRVTGGRPRKEGNAPFFGWGISSSNAIAVLTQMHPYLIVKRARSEMALRGEIWTIGWGLSSGKEMAMINAQRAS